MIDEGTTRYALLTFGTIVDEWVNIFDFQDIGGLLTIRKFEPNVQILTPISRTPLSAAFSLALKPAPDLHAPVQRRREGGQR